MSGEQPEWVTPTACPGFLEIVKSGAVIDRIPIATGTKSISFGRLPENTVCLEHESISRRHARILFGPGNSAFLYDLQSTHGTFLSKKQLPPLQYVRIAHENDVFHFGGSTRMFILSLLPLPVESVKEPVAEESASSKVSQMRKLVMKFFDENGISQRDVQVSKTEGITSCSLDFAPFLSLELGEEAMVLASGTDRSEAWNAFFEDAYNLLARLGLISAADCDSEEEEHIEDSDDEKEKEKKESKKVLTEADLVSKRDALRSQIAQCKAKISNLLQLLVQTELQEVDDFDVFIRDAKVAEIKDDIAKAERQKSAIEEELSHQYAILEAIGYKEPTTEVGQSTIETVEARTIIKYGREAGEESLITKTEPKAEKSISHIPELKTESSKKLCLQQQTPPVNDYDQFEDATNPEESTQEVNELKRKLGY